MPGSCFADRLGDIVSLTPDERLALERLETRRQPLRRGAILQRERDSVRDLYILRQGVAMSSVLLDDGSRQILRFHVAGDMLGTAAMVYREATETITALTDCLVSPFARSTFATLFGAQPRLMALIMVYNQIERAALTDRLAVLGRTSARARVAAILLDMRNRLQTRDSSIGTSFVLGLTQEEIGDATGLTAVHVNRMLRQLEVDRLIAREGGRMTFLDERELERAANFVDRYAKVDLSWLPEASG
ncbi:Crp/Fnr family transcriptional regulator [Sphingomonas sp. RB3P16]|uniref:Crp/Fnr family transcriptional regulator n=1 Tax=Parasphingomonas frigoris TaxID=3096163 RepID=UPI002FCB3277